MKTFTPMVFCALVTLASLGAASTAFGQDRIYASSERIEGRIQALSKYGANPEGGVSRVAFSEAALAGSRAMVGNLSAEALEIMSHSGLTIRDGIRRVGGDPDRLDLAARKPGDLAAYLELHIEQGAILDEADIDIGVVEGIGGISHSPREFTSAQDMANGAGVLLRTVLAIDGGAL